MFSPNQTSALTTVAQNSEAFVGLNPKDQAAIEKEAQDLFIGYAATLGVLPPATPQEAMLFTIGVMAISGLMAKQKQNDNPGYSRN
jgi:hypothetical protein